MNNKNKNSNKKARAKKNRQNQQHQQGVSGTKVGPVMAITGVGRSPAYLRSSDDVIHAKFGGMFVATNRSLGLANYLLMLDTGNTNTGGYVGLGYICKGVTSFGNLYSKFMIGQTKVTVKGISPITAQGFAIVNYEADSSGTSNPPTSSVDVANARYKCVATPAVPASFSVPVHSYYNDWKATLPDSSGSSNTENQCGVVQILGSNLGAIGDLVVMVEIETEVWFTGYRAL